MNYWKSLLGCSASIGRDFGVGANRPVHSARQIAPVLARVAVLAIVGLVIDSVLVPTSQAQIAPLPQPEFSVKDENGVDLMSFNFYTQLKDLSIGSKDHPLEHTIYSGPSGSWVTQANAAGGGTVLLYEGGDSLGVNGGDGSGVFASNAYPAACPGSLSGVQYATVRFVPASETFAASLPGCATYSTVDPTGSTLSLNQTNNTFTYTKRDGTQIIYYCGTIIGGAARCLQLQRIIYPDGRVLTYGYSANGLTQSVTRSDGLQFKYNYAAAGGNWTLTSVTAINNAYEYCSPTATTCSLTKSWPTATYSISVPTSAVSAFTVTDAAGRVVRYTSYVNGSLGIKLPSSPSADNLTYTFCGTGGSSWCGSFSQFNSIGQTSGFVVSVTRDGQTWNYTGNPGSPGYYQCGQATYGFTNPVGATQSELVYNCLSSMYPAAAPLPGFSPLIYFTDKDGVHFNAGAGGLITSAIKPEGNQVQYTWDARANLTGESLVPKSNSSVAQVNLSANYDSTCANPVKCNEPNWVKDGLGNQTDYTYDPTHGGVLTKTLPPDANGIRPQTRYTYTQRYAWVLNSSGTYVRSAAPIWVMATQSFCRTSAAAASGTGCTVAGDEVVKTYEYGPDAGPNNLFLRGIATTADGVTHRICYGLDMYGNRISETEPDAGLGSCP